MMSAHRILPALVVLLFCSPLAVPAQTEEVSPADSREEPSRRARSLFQEAEDAFQEGRYEEALEKYRGSYDLAPRPALHARIGACHQEMGNHQAAIESFERFLDEAPRSPNKAEVEARLERSRAAVPSNLLPLASLVPEEETPEAEEAQTGGEEDLLPLVSIMPSEQQPEEEAGAEDTAAEGTGEASPGRPATRSEEVAAAPGPDEEIAAARHQGEAGTDPPAQGEEAPEWATASPIPHDPRDAAGPPVFKRWWFWAAVGATAAAAGGLAYAGARPEPVYVLPSGSLGSADWR